MTRQLTKKQRSALESVRQGQIVLVVASGSMWKDEHGQTLPRGMGINLTMLRRSGLVMITSGPDDRRRYSVGLSPKGEAALTSGEYTDPWKGGSNS